MSQILPYLDSCHATAGCLASFVGLLVVLCSAYRRIGTRNDAEVIYLLKVFVAGFGLHTVVSFTGKFDIDSVCDNAHMRFGIWHDRMCACVCALC